MKIMQFIHDNNIFLNNFVRKMLISQILDHLILFHMNKRQFHSQNTPKLFFSCQAVRFAKPYMSLIEYNQSSKTI